VNVVQTIGETRLALEPSRGGSIGLVPTMGSLHEGHIALLRSARAENETVVMSLFVNPAQFGDASDLAKYPRDEERDLELAREARADLVYICVLARPVIGSRPPRYSYFCSAVHSCAAGCSSSSVWAPTWYGCS